MSANAFPAPADDGAARHLVRGLPMPSIALPTTAGSSVNFAEHPGWVLLFVYTWTGRPGVDNPPGWDTIPGAHGSTPQAEGFRNLYPTFRQQGAEIFGLSAQTTEWQREFATRMDLPFSLVSDAGLRLQRALRLPTFETGGTVYLRRLTLALKDGAIERVFYPVHPPQANAREMLAWFNELVTRKAPRGGG
jgi:peroxiredoxin